MIGVDSLSFCFFLVPIVDMTLHCLCAHGGLSMEFQMFKDLMWAFKFSVEIYVLFVM